ncbi:hypothetical protein MMC28_004740 [Mycoblastus sanguinarius]|nr:hypothetical protein [Mycoblastus sanguinarius]
MSPSAQKNPSPQVMDPLNAAADTSDRETVQENDLTASLTVDTSLQEDIITGQHSDKASHSSDSTTSTIVYSHESFDQYSLRVKDLCHALWPSSLGKSRLTRLLGNRIMGVIRDKMFRRSPTDFQIERLRGGSFNRIIGITITHQNRNDATRLILRVPRFVTAHPDREVAILNLVRQHETIPVAQVEASDFTKGNPLERPYVIQKRIAGHDLQSRAQHFLSLSHEQQCAVAKDFGRILRSIQDIESLAPGRIDIPAISDRDKIYTLRPFEVPQGSLPNEEEKLDDASYASTVPEYKDTLNFLVSQFDRWKAQPGNWLKAAYMDCFVSVACQMDRLGFLGDELNCLCHLDLNAAPRNIMVDIKPDNSTIITGILDWDSAVFAPRFVGCAPPMWIWAWNEDEDEDEKKANDIPSTLEQQELKRLFEDAVGAEFLEYAYQPQYRLARKLFEWALHGIHSNWAMEDAEEFLRDWATMRGPEMRPIRGPLARLREQTPCSGKQADEKEECDATG